LKVIKLKKLGQLIQASKHNEKTPRISRAFLFVKNPDIKISSLNKLNKAYKFKPKTILFKYKHRAKPKLSRNKL